MKVNDFVKFTRKHSSQPGFEYCAGWIGIVLEAHLKRSVILWSGDDHGCFIAAYVGDTVAYNELEIISG